MKNCYTIRHNDGRIFGKYQTKQQGMNALYLLEGTNAVLCMPSGVCIANAKHLPKRTQKKQAKKGLFARIFGR